MTSSDKPFWRERIPVPEYRHLIMMFMVFGIVLTCIILAGCTSKNLADVYLLSLSYRLDDPSKSSTKVSAALASLEGNHASLQVRVSFMGLCARLPSGDWSCSSKIDNVANAVNNVLVEQAGSGDSHDPLRLVSIARSFKDGVVFGGLFFIALGLNLISFCILSTFKVAEDDGEEHQNGDKEFWLSRLTCVTLFMSAMMTLLSVFWQHLASVGAATLLEALTSGAVSGHVGSVAAGLGWTAVAINFLTLLAVINKVLCMGVLREFYANASRDHPSTSTERVA
ncbi:Ca2+ regulator and membrane fusion protein Fig1 domain-containing protein [Trichoderma ceciliae]